ncbi:MAG: UrcA family protein [Erythrobacter sp.]|uniref:UrcA family protein n=1 Tax=Erythrobacter sp. TaxID=1042 RepID=UPI003C722481
MKLNRLTAAFATSLAAASLAGSPALADTPPPSRSVSTAGLDLSTPEGQRLLDQRIEIAARAVCQPHRMHTGSRVTSHEARECLKMARASARKQVAAKIKQENRGG